VSNQVSRGEDGSTVQVQWFIGHADCMRGGVVKFPTGLLGNSDHLWQTPWYVTCNKYFEYFISFIWKHFVFYFGPHMCTSLTESAIVVFVCWRLPWGRPCWGRNTVKWQVIVGDVQLLGCRNRQNYSLVQLTNGRIP